MGYTIYLRTNLINGKQYVGQTCDFKRRSKDWNNLSIRYANKFLTEDREKYGLDNFKTTVLDVVETREEAWEQEKYYIKELGTKFPNGYNRANGGKDSSGTFFTEEHRQKLADIKKEAHFIPKTAFKKGIEPWNKGVKDCFSQEVVKKMSEKHKGMHNSPSTEFKKGCKKTDNWKKAMALMTGERNANSKGVYQCSLDGEFVNYFESGHIAAKETNSMQSKISLCCQGKRKTHNGFKWFFKEDYEKMLTENHC